MMSIVNIKGHRHGVNYYELKRSKYKIEQSVYNYVCQTNFDIRFYVFVISPYELISSSGLGKNYKLYEFDEN